MADIRPIDASYQDKNLKWWLDTNCENGVVHIPKSVIIKILKQPTLDYAPVVHAHWKELIPLLTMQTRSYKCSKCRRTIKLKIGDDLIKEYPYCICGAKMDLKDNDDKQV